MVLSVTGTSMVVGVTTCGTVATSCCYTLLGVGALTLITWIIVAVLCGVTPALILRTHTLSLGEQLLYYSICGVVMGLPVL